MPWPRRYCVSRKGGERSFAASHSFCPSAYFRRKSSCVSRTFVSGSWRGCGVWCDDMVERQQKVPDGGRAFFYFFFFCFPSIFLFEVIPNIIEHLTP